jgi:hypothetical protein
MGWKPGEGLGKNQSGSLEPLLLDVKMDKRGVKRILNVSISIHYLTICVNRAGG